MKVAAVVPAKSTSDRIFEKNTQIVAGYPLFIYKIISLLSVHEIDEVYLDTDSEEFIKMASYLPIKILKRDKKLATNETDGHELFYNECKNIDADIIVQALCTSPFVSKKTIAESIYAVSRNGSNYDSSALFTKEKIYEWNEKDPKYGRGKIPNSSELAEISREAMSLYVMRRETALHLKTRFGRNIKKIFVSPIESIDINTKEDLEAARSVADGLLMKEYLRLKALSKLLSSAMLSDIMDELEIRNCVVPPLKCGMPSVAVFGRAKTLRLRKLSTSDIPSQIYDSMKIYDYVSPGDIIAIENELDSSAFFGDLNARLAVRRGAAAAIVGGATRDSCRVARLGFPVFFESLNAQDVRGRAVVDSINQPITISGLKVLPGELMFADSDALVKIPFQREDDVLALADEKIRIESDISLEILRGDSAEEILERHGSF